MRLYDICVYPFDRVTLQRPQIANRKNCFTHLTFLFLFCALDRSEGCVRRRYSAFGFCCYFTTFKCSCSWARRQTRDFARSIPVYYSYTHIDMCFVFIYKEIYIFVFILYKYTLAVWNKSRYYEQVWLMLRRCTIYTSCILWTQSNLLWNDRHHASTYLYYK